MKRLFLCPVRINSKRIDKKILKEIDFGRNMVHNALIKMNYLKQDFPDWDFHLSISKADFDEIKNLDADKYKNLHDLLDFFNVIRPGMLVHDDITIYDILNYYFGEYDGIGVLNCTSVFLDYNTLNDCMKRSEDCGLNSYDSVITVQKLQEFMLNWKRERANFKQGKFEPSQNLKPLYVVTTGYMYSTKDVFKKYDSQLGAYPDLVLLSRKRALDINFPEDFEDMYTYLRGHRDVQ